MPRQELNELERSKDDMEDSRLAETFQNDKETHYHGLTQNRKVTRLLKERQHCFANLSNDRNQRVAGTELWISIKREYGHINRDGTSDR